MLSLAHMKLAQSALKAWQRKDWDALASIVIPLLPSLPNDGKPHTPTRERDVFRKVIPSLTMPKPLEQAAYKYLDAASDVQLRVIAQHVHELSTLLNTPAPERAGERSHMRVMK